MRTRIVCTIGPAGDGATSLTRMMQAGMVIARLNFSHGTHIEHQRRIELIRRLNRKCHRNTLILQDLAGFRIRIGKFRTKQGVLLKKGQQLLLTNQPIICTDKILSFGYDGQLSDIKAGSHIFIDDGNIALRALSVRGKYIKTEVIIPGPLTDHKGVNIPDVNLRFSGMTAKDRADLLFGIKHKVDFVAQSFVRDRNDILPVRKLLNEYGATSKIIAKIENRQGIRNIDEIIDVTDGIMIARGDMGVSIPIFKIPVVQKEIIKKCLALRQRPTDRTDKMVITATQMLESMVEHFRPTRAEVTDVANAVLDGTDYVMLSAETAAGRYPVESVEVMKRIIEFTEKYQKAIKDNRPLPWKMLWAEG